MDDSEPRPKRSRFDQTEPEPKRASRFDRRSRSPPTRRPEGRDRSPLQSEEASDSKPSASDPAAAAAAAAARINAQLQARRGFQHAEVPSVQPDVPQSGDTRPPLPESAGDKGPAIHGEMYVADGDYIQDIEINDLRNRYLVIKAPTLQMIMKETSTDITTRGKYYPNKAMATAQHPPLYLHITSTTKAGLEGAVGKINDLMQQDLPQLVDERRFRRRDQEPEQVQERPPRRKWAEEKIAIGLDPIPGFNLRAQIVGQGGSYVKHIQQETRCKVQIKGRGSGFLESTTNQESDEDMFLHVAGPDEEMVIKAKELCEDLVANVKEQYEEFKTRPPRHHDRGYGGGDRGYGGGERYGGGGGGGGGGDHYRSGGGGGGHGRDSNNASYGRYNSDGAPTNSPAPGAANSAASATDYAAQYAQYYQANPGADPYAAYGGYANYVAMYNQYYSAYQGQPGQPGGGQSGSPPPPPPAEAAPPPPPTGNPPPPPPPSGSPPGATGSYGSVPPPPGL